jgi:bacteriorhodopsin
MGKAWAKVKDSDVATKPPVMGAVFLQMATAAMLGGTLIAVCAAIARQSYDCTMAAGVCGVAYVHYTAMGMLRWREASEKLESFGPFNVDQAVALLRYSDWLVTMPLLVLKVLNMARDGPVQTSDFLENEYIPTGLAALAMLMIVCGYVSSAVYGEVDSNKSIFGPRIGLYLVGMVCLTLIYLVLFFTALESESRHTNEVFGFALLWVAYPLVFLSDLMWGLSPNTKDAVYAILDTVSKPMLTLYFVVHVFGVA